jgi:hypothetical protein
MCGESLERQDIMYKGSVGYEITRRQTTFWDLRHEGGLDRIHFLGKEEFAFVEPRAPSYLIVDEHPVLVDYQFAWESIYLAGADDAPEPTLRQIHASIQGQVDGWRPAARYLNPFGAERILRDGYGQLLSAPVPIAEVSRAALRAAGVRFTSLPARPACWPRQALIVGLNYVVAQSFRVEPLT